MVIACVTVLDFDFVVVLSDPQYAYPQHGAGHAVLQHPGRQQGVPHHLHQHTGGPEKLHNKGQVSHSKKPLTLFT